MLANADRYFAYLAHKCSYETNKVKKLLESNLPSIEISDCLNKLQESKNLIPLMKQLETVCIKALLVV